MREGEGLQSSGPLPESTKTLRQLAPATQLATNERPRGTKVPSAAPQLPKGFRRLSRANQLRGGLSEGLPFQRSRKDQYAHWDRIGLHYAPWSVSLQHYKLAEASKYNVPFWTRTC